MSARRLTTTLHGYRIGDPNGRYPIFDSTGSSFYPGRWHSTSTPVIYASEHYATAMLEKLAQSNGILPSNQHWVKLTFPKRLTYEQVTPSSLPGWDTNMPSVSVDFGMRWYREQRSAILIVPSYVARVEKNIVINPHHPQFNLIRCSEAERVIWDERLFDLNAETRL